MLLLSRRIGQRLVIAEITVVEIRGNTARLGVTAPHNISVVRAEVGARNSTGDGVQRDSASGGQELEGLLQSGLGEEVAQRVLKVAK